MLIAIASVKPNNRFVKLVKEKVMIHVLKKVGETFNTEYPMYGPVILVVVPAHGYKDHVPPRGWMIKLAGQYKF